MRYPLLASIVSAPLVLVGCAAQEPYDDTVSADEHHDTAAPTESASSDADAAPVTDLDIAERGTVDDGWSMAFLPAAGDASADLLIAQRTGGLLIRDAATGDLTPVDGVPEVHTAGQAGLHDVAVAPDFAETGTLYLSWVRPHEQGAQGVVGTARLDAESHTLDDLGVIWEQTPAAGDGHFALRLHLDDEHLYVTSGDRQEMDPAQETETNHGAVLRLTHTGEPAPGNPWAEDGSPADELFTIGHRNPLGIASDADGRIWISEMGPAGGDELNLLAAGENYGWPLASMGEHYDGSAIDDHSDADDFRAPAHHWDPSISPGSLHIYTGDLFTGWAGSALLGGLSGETLVRVALDGEEASLADAFDMGERIRALAEAPDGALWVLEDGPGGRLLEVRPA